VTLEGPRTTRDFFAPQFQPTRYSPAMKKTGRPAKCVNHSASTVKRSKAPRAMLLELLEAQTCVKGVFQM